MHKRTWATLTIALLIGAMVAVAAFYIWENSALQTHHLHLEQQVNDLNSQLYYLTKGVNLTLVDLQINDLSYMAEGVPALNIGGYMKNSGGGSVSGVELQVTAQENGSVLMNITVPFDDYSAYEYKVNQKQHDLLAAGSHSWIHQQYVGEILQSTTYGPRIDYLHQGDNRTIVGSFANDYFLLRIYHQNLFSNTTTYKVLPIWRDPK